MPTVLRRGVAIMHGGDYWILRFRGV